MSTMLTGSLFTSLATSAFAALPNVLAALPSAKKISRWALGYVLLSLAFALLWVLVVSAGRYYQRRYIRLAAQMRFVEGAQPALIKPLREDWAQEDQDLFAKYLQSSMRKV